MALIKCNDCSQVISASATSCPHCGAPTPAAPIGFAKAFGWVILGLIVVVIGLAGIGSLIPKSEADQARDLQIEACTAAEDFVKQHLRTPGTAEFPSCSEIATFPNGSANGWTMTGYVDAQNGFGAKIRSNWTVSATRTSQDHWTATNVAILDR